MDDLLTTDEVRERYDKLLEKHGLPPVYGSPEIRYLLRALEAIANADYRGNRSTESQQAEDALNEFARIFGPGTF